MTVKSCYAKERNYFDSMPSRNYSLAIRGDLASIKDKKSYFVSKNLSFAEMKQKLESHRSSKAI